MEQMSREQLIGKLQKIQVSIEQFARGDLMRDQIIEVDRTQKLLMDVVSDELFVPELSDYFFQDDLPLDEIADLVIESWEKSKQS